MTANQIAYQTLKENERSHRAGEHLQTLQQRETARANVAAERLKAAATSVQHEYNLGTLALGRSQLAESIRHSKASELLTRQQMVLGNDRSRLEREQSNRLTQQQQSIDAKYKSAMAAISAKQAAETARSNMAREMLTNAQTQETQRHNARMEELGFRQSSLGYQIATLDRASRERIANSQNLTSVQVAGINAFARVAQGSSSNLAKLIRGGK